MLFNSNTNKLNSNNRIWYVYILLCNDDSLYTGISLDIYKRFKMHKSGKGAKYTKIHGAREIVYSEKYLSHREAVIREIKIKKLTKRNKVKLISGINSHRNKIPL